MGAVKDIHVDELAQLLQDSRVYLIDVRQPFEFKGESIKEAINVPLDELSSEHSCMTDCGDKRMVIICQSGMRSKAACDKLQTASPDVEVTHVTGGLNAWKQQGLPIVASKNPQLPLDRQVQIAIGILILFGLTMAVLVSPYWLLLNLIVGLGLINAGVTGWCGLGKLVALMPWNRG